MRVYFLYGAISHVSVSLIICTGGAYRPFLHDRHFSAASSFHIGVSRGRLAGGDFQAIHSGNPPLDAEAVATIRDGSAYRLYVWGEVRYFDIFNIERVTKFRLMQGGPNFRPGKLEICEEGNEAD
jgi:hypothetical protein